MVTEVLVSVSFDIGGAYMRLLSKGLINHFFFFGIAVSDASDHFCRISDLLQIKIYLTNFQKIVQIDIFFLISF